MFHFLKAAPTTYVLHYRNGRPVREGAGLSFFYYGPTSTIVTIAMASTDSPFAFQEATADFQSVAIQGQVTYRVSDPKRLASVLDLSVSPGGAYKTDDYQKLGERLVHTTQALMRAELQKMSLQQALTSSGPLSSTVFANLRSAESVSELGIEVLNLLVLSIRPTPEMAKALEAEAREALQRRSDEAIYARRNNAVEQERLIKESELNTEIALEEKQKQIRETRMAADIAIEKQRAALTDQRIENERKEADSRGYALEATLKPVRDLDWRTLMTLFAQGGDPKALIASAFMELATNAQKIGELNISPDLLNSLLAAKPAAIAAPVQGKGK
jgi:regulator of protease activity HflC (stomatin/prohibitin superfamily)